MSEKKNTWVYVMAHRGGGLAIKIGITKNPDSRVKQVQTGSPLPVYLAHSIGPMTPSAARWAERVIHEVYDEFRMCGEWFTLEPWDGARVLNRVWQSVQSHG